MINSRNIIEQLVRSLSHPDQHRRVTPGLTLGSDAHPISAPLLGSSVIQRVEKGEAWGEIDILDAYRFMRIHVFGEEGDLLGFAVVDYIDNTHKPSFDAPLFNAATDMLMMVATGTSSDQLTRRLFALEDVEDIESIGVRNSVLSLAAGLNEHNFIGALEQSALMRGRTRLALHSMGENKRYKQLLGGFNFTRHKTSDGYLFLKEVADS